MEKKKRKKKRNKRIFSKKPSKILILGEDLLIVITDHSKKAENYL
jgi:hypothetical protein